MAGAKRRAKQPEKSAATKTPSSRAAKKPAPKRSRGARPAGTAAGDARVSFYIAQLKGEQKAIASTLDALVEKHVPGVVRALKWNVPFYGVAGRGWFCAFSAFTNHTNVNFFRGVELVPVPPDGGVKANRRVVYRTLADVDEPQLASWIRQAAALPGWLAPDADPPRAR